MLIGKMMRNRWNFRVTLFSNRPYCFFKWRNLSGTRICVFDIWGFFWGTDFQVLFGKHEKYDNLEEAHWMIQCLRCHAGWRAADAYDILKISPVNPGTGVELRIWLKKMTLVLDIVTVGFHVKFLVCVLRWKILHASPTIHRLSHQWQGFSSRYVSWNFLGYIDI